MNWLVPPNELTPDQQRAIELSPLNNIAITGGPGSGKTMVLVYRAQFLSKKYKTSPARYRILVYTNILKDYIKSALNLLDLPEDNVLVFANWCHLFHEKYIGRVPWNKSENVPDFRLTQLNVKDYILSGRIDLPIYDFLMVDEGQDLDKDAFQIISRLAAHVTVCMDDKQQIYETGISSSEIISALGIRRTNISFIEAFRVCPYIVKLASHFIPTKSEREAFEHQNRLPQVEKETPMFYLARDFENEREMLVSKIGERLLKNDRIVVLFPTNRQLYGFAMGMKEHGLDVEIPRKYRSRNENGLNFSSSLPKLMTYFGAKGLTFDAVFMPRLLSQSFERFSEARVEKLLFVGITRATKWVYLSTIDGNSLPALDRLIQLEQSGSFSVVRHDQSLIGNKAKPKILDARAKKSDFDFL